MNIRYNVMRPLVLISRLILSVGFIFVWDDLAINHCEYYARVRQKTASIIEFSSLIDDLLSRIFWTRFLYDLFDLDAKRRTCANETVTNRLVTLETIFRLIRAQTREDPS